MKFSIRDLLLVTVIVALAVGWWVDHVQLKVEMDGLRADVEFLESKNPFAYSAEGGRMNYPSTSSAPVPNPPKP